MLIQQFPLWLLVAVFVAIVFLLHMRKQIVQISKKLAPQELFTLAKFLLLSAVILPLLPDKQVIDWLSIIPFKIWLAVVVVSAISYFGYVAQRYFFREQGVLITAIFGGIYSSTATTVVLAKQSKDEPQSYYRLSGGIVLATNMMYLRLWAIAAIFQWQIAKMLAFPMFVLAALSDMIALLLLRREHRHHAQSIPFEDNHYNPLDLKVALTLRPCLC